MYGIGKLQTVAGCKVRLPCPDRLLLQVARLTVETGALTKSSIKSWGRLICGHPSLLVFCIDRFLYQYQRPPTELKQLARWARTHLADALSLPKVIKPLKDDKNNGRSKSVVKSWRSADSVCAYNKALYTLMRQPLPKQVSPQPIKRWLNSACKELLSDPKFPSLKKSAAGASCDGIDGFSISTLRSLLRSANESLHQEKLFQTRLQTEKLAALKELAYGASHEINNPLANIATGAQALMQLEPDEDRRHRLANIYQQSMAAHEMISDLMLFAHPPAPEMKTEDLRGMISAIVNRAQQQNRSIRVTFGPNVDSAKIDRNQIIIAIEALLRNAFEAIAQMESPPTPKVSLRIDVVSELATDWIRIFVVDNGPGFTKQQKRHLFDPFYSGREAGRGLGFGLSKAYRIVKLHHGEIMAQRDADIGETTFLIKLPTN